MYVVLVNVAILTLDKLFWLANVRSIMFIKNVANVVANHRLAMWACTLRV